MYILNKKYKFISIFHSDDKPNILFIGLFIYTIICIYNKLYMTSMLSMLWLISSKITYMYMELENHYTELSHSEWMEFKNNLFIKKILKYTKFIIYPISTMCIIIHLYLYFNYNISEYISKIFNILVVISHIIILYLYNSISVELK